MSQQELISRKPDSGPLESGIAGSDETRADMIITSDTAAQAGKRIMPSCPMLSQDHDGTDRGISPSYQPEY